MTRLLKLACGSIAIAICTLFIKYGAYAITGSMALYSDALDGIANLVASIVLLVAVYFSDKPADSTHHYGRHKAQYLSELVESLCLLVAATIVFKEAMHALFDPRPFDQPILGLLISSVGTFLNGVWGWILYQQGQRHDSPALIADGTHLLIDVFSSSFVLLGLLSSIVFSWPLLDPVIAFLVGAHIFYVGLGLAKEAIDGLMDRSPSVEEQKKIYQLILQAAPEALEVHALKLRRAGPTLFVDFHLVVLGTMFVQDAHKLCDHIEEAIKTHWCDSVISIHVEPETCLEGLTHGNT